MLAQSAPTDAVTEALGALQTVLEYAGTVAFAISGALVAGRARMDLVGVAVLGVIVAVGGGTLRDLLIGREPVFWVTSPTFLVVAAGVALATIPLQRRGVLKAMQQLKLVSLTDAAGMALFVVTGTNVALEAGANKLAAAVVGVITGIGGGIIRDLLANRIPEVLRDGQFYATAALAGSLLYVLLLELSVSPLTAVWVPILVIFGIRSTSIFLGWSLPAFELQADDAQDTGDHDGSS